MSEDIIIAIDMMEGDTIRFTEKGGHPLLETLCRRYSSQLPVLTTLADKFHPVTRDIEPVERAVAGIGMFYETPESKGVKIDAVGDSVVINRELRQQGLEGLVTQGKVNVVHSQAYHSQTGIIVPTTSLAPSDNTIPDTTTKEKLSHKDTGLALALQMHASKKSGIFRHRPSTEDAKRNVDAALSMGNTKYIVISSLKTLGKIAHTSFAMMGFLPTEDGRKFAMLDLGANIDDSPETLFQSAYMAGLYFEKILGKTDYTIGVLSNGTEPSKGTAETKKAVQLIKKDNILGSHLIETEGNSGYVEPKDLFQGKVDICVTDGVTGNIFIKTAEYVPKTFQIMAKRNIRGYKSRLSQILAITGALLLKPTLEALREETDPAKYGAVPLLGIDGIVMVGHGTSDSEAYCNGIKASVKCVRENLLEIYRSIPKVTLPLAAYIKS